MIHICKTTEYFTDKKNETFRYWLFALHCKKVFAAKKQRHRDRRPLRSATAIPDVRYDEF